MTRPVILIVGGTGVLDPRLARWLLERTDFDIVVAGRDAAKGDAFCRHGGRFVAIDRTDPGMPKAVAELGPALVIDAAGPFQSYTGDPYVLARAAVACGAHYFDLSDDAAFTEGIVGLDAEARAQGVCVLSGASSVPALSAAAADVLGAGMAEVHLIESVILPGNRAPRGLSLVRAILTQVGRPLPVVAGSGEPAVTGWSGMRRETISMPGGVPIARLSSRIGAPDLGLFPERYKARAVLFRAGLELRVMHIGLWFLGGLVRAGLMSSLEPLAHPLKAIADRFERCGTDRGGMRVSLVGRTPDSRCLRRDWSLIAESGAGPSIPGVPGRVLCGKMLAGAMEPGRGRAWVR